MMDLIQNVSVILNICMLWTQLLKNRFKKLDWEENGMA